jgi:hypothetical protein
VTLDLAKVSPQIRRMGQRLQERQALLRAALAQAQQVLADWAPRWEALRDLAETRERGQRLASPREPLDLARSAPPLASDHLVLATDGSQIEPDRHGPAEYYLLNVGWAVLRYGAEPAASLASEPRLAYELEELFVVDASGRRRVPVQGSHLSARRAVLELEWAVELAAEQPAELPLVVLQDGTLLLWVLEERPEDFLRDAFLRPYVAAIERCRALGRPLASYVSRPRSTEVSALLRTASCGGDLAACAACGVSEQPVCALDGLHDRMLFEHLGEGQRSALFASTLHEKLERYYAGHRIHFFYLNVGSELARVEVPRWVAEDPAALGLVQAVVYDQCRRGQGYPVVLTRSHEQAVVRSADRAMMRLLLANLFAQRGLRARFSEKEAAKRLHAV